MYVNDLGVREVNEYYARKNSVNRLSNVNSFAQRLQKAAENRRAAESSKTDSAASAGSEGTCCEKCALNNNLAALSSQLVKQMMSQSAYSQAGLGLIPTGTGALSAYQSMMKLFGNGLFS